MLRANEPRGRRVAMLLFFLSASVVGVGAGIESSFDRNYRRIERMSASERMRLERNFRRFQEMTEAERDGYRRLHREIEEDTLKGGRLRDVLDGYNAWLATLSPFQRQEILAEKDPIERVNIVRRIRRDMAKQPSAPTEQRPGPLARLLRMSGMLAQLADDSIQLLPREFDNLVGVLETRLSLSKEDLSKLQAMSPAKRHLEVLKRTLEKFPDEMPPEPGRLWPDDQLLEKLLASIDNKLITDKIKTFPDPNVRRKVMGFLVARALLAEWQPKIDSLRPTDDDLWQMFQDMEPTRRDEFMQLPTEEMKHRLELEFLATRSPELRELPFVLQRLASRPERPLGNRPRPRPFDRRPGPGPRGFAPGESPEPPDGRGLNPPGRRRFGPPEGPPPERPENGP